MITVNILQSIYLGVLSYYLYNLHYDVRAMEYDQVGKALDLKHELDTLKKRLLALESKDRRLR